MARAGDIIYLARKRAKISQTRLSQRSGVPQGVISQYESHKMQPSFEAVEHLVGCCDLRLDVFLEHRNDKDVPGWVSGSTWRIANLARQARIPEVWVAPAAEPRGKYRLIVWAYRAHDIDVLVTSMTAVERHELEVLDAARLPSNQWRPAARSAVPVLLSEWKDRRETRIKSIPPDDRWYACRTPGVTLSAFRGRRDLDYYLRSRNQRHGRLPILIGPAD